MQLYKLKELYSISSGLSKPASQFGYGNPFLSFSIVFNNYHIPSSLIDLVNTSPLEIKRFSIKRGDVFVTRTSEKLDELGKSCVALQDYEKATFNGFCKRLRPIVNESIILPEYAQYLFRSKQFTNQIIYSCPMSTRASLNEEILNTIVLNIHSLSEQRHIVDIIGSLDDKIENNNKIIEKLWQKLQLVHTDFKSKNELVEKNILELADIKYGKGIPTSEILKDGLYSVYGSNGIIGYLNNYTFKEHKIAISCRGNSSGIIHLTDENSTVTSNSLVLDFKNFDYTYYFFLEFMYKGLYEYKTGSAQPQITIDNLKILNLQVPKNINDYIKNINDSVEYTFCLKKENQKLFLLKQFYLKKFFG
jgi:type I restriction enzyme S subunit